MKIVHGSGANGFVVRLRYSGEFSDCAEMEAAALATGAMLNAALQPDRRHRSQTLFYLFVMLMDGRALASAENCKTGEGLELWCKLVDAHELKAGTRAAGLLVKILTVDVDMSDFLNTLEKRENFIKQHDAIVDELEDVQERVEDVHPDQPHRQGCRAGSLLGGSCEVREPRTTQEGPGHVPFCEETPRWRQLRIACRRSRPRRSYTHGDRNGQRTTREETTSTTQRRRQRSTSSTDVRTLENMIAGAPRKANLSLALARASPVNEGKAWAKARTKTTRPSGSASGMDATLETEEPGKEVRGLTNLCAVERMGNYGLKQICAVEEIRRIEISVDLGAAAPVWPRDLCKYNPTKKTENMGTKYATAGKDSKHLVNQQERMLLLRMEHDITRGGRIQVTSVRKPLTSVADMHDVGQDVYFLTSGQSFAVDKETGMFTSSSLTGK